MSYLYYAFELYYFTRIFGKIYIPLGSRATEKYWTNHAQVHIATLSTLLNFHRRHHHHISVYSIHAGMFLWTFT